MTTQPDSEVSDHQLMPLSNDELELISGGTVNVSLTLLMGEDSSASASQDFSGDDCSSRSISGYRRRSRFGLQFSGSFASMEHFSSFFSDFMRGFRD